MRGAASIGSGLEPGREARAILPAEQIHVVGAAGAGASAAALHAHGSGAAVSGCDPGGPSPYTPPLEAAGIPLAWSHDSNHVTDGRPDRLAVTKALTAVDPDNPELVAARKAGVPLEPWQQVVADAAVGRLLVGVAGTHGKSTSSGWLVHVLTQAGRDPSAFVGALMPGSITAGLPSTARRGDGAAFVVEADEYAGNFDPYRPAIAVLTSAEWDHPDVFADEAAVVACFEAWLRQAALSVASPFLVANVSDRGVAAVVERLRDWSGRVVATTLAESGAGAVDIAGHAAFRERFATAAGPADLLVGRIVESGPAGRSWRSAGRPVERPSRHACAWPAGTTPPMPWEWPGPRPVSAFRSTRSQPGCRASAASGGAWSGRERGVASWCTTTTATIRRP